MQVGVVLSLVVFSVGLSPAWTWDIAVAVKDTIQFVNVSGAVVGNVSEGMSQVQALAYNAELRHMYFSDNEREEGSVFEMSVPGRMHVEGEKVGVSPVVTKQAHDVKGIAYDPMTGILYWSNGGGHSIQWLRVGTSGAARGGQPLLLLGEQIPMGLAIDTCKRYLYWSNCNSAPTIERSLLDGSERQTLISSDLELPYSVVVDQTTDRLYWADERSGFQFRIESSTMDGKDRKVIIHGSHHQPFALAVSAGSVFWADNTHMMVWRVPLDGSTTTPLPVQMYESTPQALVSAQSGKWVRDRCNPVTEPRMKVIPATVTVIDTNSVSHAINSSHDCKNSGLYRADRGNCDCLPGYSGTLCEVNECTDFCVNGVCHFASGQRNCQCQEGYVGERCETSVCHNFCVTGSCSIDITGQPQCHCKEGFSGDRCEVNFTHQQELKDDFQEVCKAFCKLWSQSSKDNIQPFDVCSCPEYETLAAPMDSDYSHEYALMVLLAFCSVLMVVIAVLVQKVYVLRKRPRIKKRIIVNKSVTPLTCRPNQSNGGGGEQCEITIENCCNMNICETPCFEPDFRQPEDSLSRSNNRSSKDEKKTLLGNMELPPDDLY